ncbi:hypothetical protein KKG41_00100 [Patescibacteria group bacterium]|nr:hypothetical protein [Patescibacteria group bacterium]MBU1890562.1 hypothetical protein [Patescibacteria group bacterium]
MDEKFYKKLKTYKTVSIISSSIAVALFMYILIAPAKEVATAPNGDFTRFQGSEGPRGGMFGFGNISELVDSNGQVDVDAIADMKTNMPGGMNEFFLERFSQRLDSSVQNGEITQSQADDIYKELAKQ